MALEAATNEGRLFAIGQAHKRLRRLALQITRATRSSTADAVHDVRVAIRRFTQSISVCQTYFRGSDKWKNRRRLKKIMTAAGEVRNCDVGLKFIVKFREPHSVQLRPKLQSLRKESEGVLLTELRKWTDRKMSVKWHADLDSAPSPSKGNLGAETADELARRLLGRTAKDFLKRGNQASSPQASPKGLHHFRIAAKKFRYALELFEPLYGSSLDPIVASIKDTSTLLGEINDSVTVAAMVADYKGGGRLAARLKKRQHKKTNEFRKYWDQTFGDGYQLRSAIDRLTLVEPQVERKPAASSQSASGRRKSAA